MSDIRVHAGGLFTTVQDLGRPGYYRIGMPPSGAMDQYSASAANLLVGNEPNTGLLEATYIGPTLEFTDDRLIAVTGATAPVTVNGEPVEAWTAVAVGPGDVLGFSMLTAGARLYIAVSGGIDVPVYLGSRSTYTLTGIGGFDGRKLADADRLPLGEAGTRARAGRSVPESLRPDFDTPAELRTIIGLCSYRLTEQGLQTFLDTDWKITKDANRVGYRLRGGSLEFTDRAQPFGAGSDPANVVDLGYPVGSIQLPGGDEPIVLLNDAVTGGGYATTGTVISVDRDRIGQAKTGETVRFVETDLDTALTARRERAARIDTIREALTGN
ncbi:biotin-dependent carboxyltransferase family protein [Sciscionella sediminilitoris]|uniref:5-oxoprolinase subunit C family protein n=1 Tax=Sciscionella sediminilitoris TaxID=1445613 RepID=UPI0004DEDDB7|nr:biotin-dependent carboxyltransferase family protein [Sciscionella sp. SE31]